MQKDVFILMFSVHKWVGGQLWSLYRDVAVQTTATHPPPPGLSSALVSKVTGGNFPAPDQLEKVRADGLNVTSSLE